MAKRCSLIVAVLLGLWACQCAATAWTRPQYHHTAWAMADGAPADIWALAQGPDGYLWLGTGTGLYRFDGISFERVAPPKDKPFASNNITALYAASDGSLWIGFFLGGVSVLRDGRFHHYPPDTGTPTDLVLGFAEDNDHAIWVAAKRGFRRFDGRRWEPVGSDWGYPQPSADYLLVDSKGTLWVTTGTTLVYLPRGSHRFRSTGEVVGDYASLVEAPDGTLWISDGLHGTRPLPNVREPGRIPVQLPKTNFARLACMRIDDAGTLWGTDRTVGGVIRISDLPRFKGTRGLRPEDVDAIVRERDGLTSDRTIPVLKDREGNIWVGTNLGLHRFRYANVRTLLDERLTQHSLYGVTFSPPHGVLVSSGTRLYRIQDGELELVAETSGRDINGVVANGDGALWFKSEQTLLRFAQGRFERLRLPLDNGGLLSAVFGDGKSGLLVMQVGNGLYQHDGEQWTPIASGEISATIGTALTREADGTVWVGYPANKVARWRRGAYRFYTERDGLNVGSITALAKVGDRLLVAGENGLAVLHGERFHSLGTTDPDVLRGITGIVATRRGDIWMNGIHGIIQLPPGALAEAMKEANAILTYRVFDTRDGLVGVAEQSSTTTTVSVDDKGRIWFATSQGLATVDPDRLRHNANIPPVHIRALVAGNRRHPADSRLVLPEGTRDLHLEYSAASLSVPERVRFRYRLEGVDQAWQDAGNRRQAFYTNLEPGEYRFRVTAANDSGVWNDEGASFAFAIEPHFTQTWWFAALCVVAVTGLLFVLYLLRARQLAERLRMRLEERHRERERIARELHDTLLQSFQGLVLRFQAIANRIPAGDPIRHALEQVMDRADEAIVEGRDRVRDLRAAMPCSSLDLPEAFAKVGAELAAVHSAEFQVTTEGRLPVMDPVIGDEVFWIGREALSNAFRHAQAKRIEVEISASAGLLSFRFRDDGQGMSDEVRQSGGKSGHWGVAGMAERAKAISADLRIWSRPGKGTEVELALPQRALHPVAGWRAWYERIRREWRRRIGA